MVEGRPFGHYRLMSLIGRGGMGEVWRAHDTATDRVVALKVLPPHLADDQTFQKRFRREARVAAALTEPHIVPIHGYGEIDGHLYVDMRLIVGEDLESILAQGPLAPARAVAIVEQVGTALQAAHEEGLVHRDVKPSNILVTKNDFAYLIDFGIARAAGSTGLTSTGSTIGTWAYMAPERFGTGEPDPRSDVYALACVLHQCLTAQRPFPGDSVEQQVSGHLSTPPPRPSEINESVPPAFNDVIGKGMAKNVDDRYSTASELADAALDALGSGGPSVHSEATRPLRGTHSAPTLSAPPQQHGPSLPDAAETQYRETVNAGIAAGSAPDRTTSTNLLRRRSILIPAIVVVVAVSVAAGLLFARPHRGADQVPNTNTSAAQPTSTEATEPTFDGTFTVDLGTRTAITGAPQEQSSSAEPVTWVARSICDAGRCVASTTTVNRKLGPLTFSFDFIDGQWVGVSETPVGECATGPPGSTWRQYKLTPQPDGSLTGRFILAIVSDGMNCGASQYSTVTVTRTGDADPGVQLADPGSFGPYVPSPAQAFWGRYRYVMQNTTGDRDRDEEDRLVETFCLRTGERCLSFASTAVNVQSLVFADGQWTRHGTGESPCPDGDGTRVNDYRLTFPLPATQQDPIQVLSGTGSITISGDCKGAAAQDLSFTRTSD